MSIATRINEIQEHVGNAYSSLDDLGIDLSNVDKNIENISPIIDEIYNSYPKVTGSGENVTLENTKYAKMETEVGGNSKQDSTTGAQLFDLNKVTSVIGGTLNDDVISNNNSDINVTLSFPTITLPAGTYYISADIKSVSGSKQVRGLNDSVTGYTEVTKPTLTSSYQRYVFKYTYDTSKNLSKILIGFTNTSGVCDVKNIMISSTNTYYEPYTGATASPNPDYPQDVRVVTGENTVVIENKNNLNFTNETNANKDLFTYTSETPELISCTKKASGSSFYAKFEAYIKENEEYILSIEDTSSCTFYCYTDELWGNSVSGLSNINVSKSVPFTFTAPYTGKMIIGFYGKGTITLTKPQLEEGSTATTYEEHKEQDFPISLGNIELCKIGEYKDYIYKDNDKWYVHKMIDKVVLDGTQTSPTLNTSEETTTKLFYNYDLLEYNAKQGYGICNRLIQRNVWTGSNEGFYFDDNSKKMILRIRKAIIGTTENEVNTYLANNNIIAYYVLATPTDIEITDTTLINQLEAIYNTAKSYDDTTNIIQENNDLPFILDIKTLKKS